MLTFLMFSYEILIWTPGLDKILSFVRDNTLCNVYSRIIKFKILFEDIINNCTELNLIKIFKSLRKFL